MLTHDDDMLMLRALRGGFIHALGPRRVVIAAPGNTCVRAMRLLPYRIVTCALEAKQAPPPKLLEIPLEWIGNIDVDETYTDGHRTEAGTIDAAFFVAQGRGAGNAICRHLDRGGYPRTFETVMALHIKGPSRDGNGQLRFELFGGFARDGVADFESCNRNSYTCTPFVV